MITFNVASGASVPELMVTGVKLMAFGPVTETFTVTGVVEKSIEVELKFLITTVTVSALL